MTSGVGAAMAEGLRERGRSQEDEAVPANVPLRPLLEEEEPQRLTQEPSHHSVVALHQIVTSIGII